METFNLKQKEQNMDEKEQEAVDESRERVAKITNEMTNDPEYPMHYQLARSESAAEIVALYDAWTKAKEGVPGYHFEATTARFRGADKDCGAPIWKVCFEGRTI